MRARWLLCLALLGAACGDAERLAPVPVAAPAEPASPPTAPAPADLDACTDLGLTARPFEGVQPSEALYAKAADVVIPTLAGNRRLSTSWTGCDVHLFIQDRPRQNTGYDWTIPLWARDIDTLLENAPKNTRFFFSAGALTDTAARAEVTAMRERVEGVLAELPAEEGAWWRERIHYVDVATRNLPGWLGAVMQNPGWGVGIDRLQRIRYIGSYADPTRFSNAAGWFAPNLSMAANEAVYYNFEALREERLAAQDALVVNAFPGGEGSQGEATDVMLPDAEALAGYDSLELDMTMACIGEGEFGTCPAWDYMAYVYLCTDPEDPDQCDVELGRWITTYHREGRWVHDVSPLLPLLKSGGVHRMKFQSQNSYEVKLDLRFFNAAKDARPVDTSFLFSGFGVSFNATYNDNFTPIVRSIPSDAKKVELAVVISGHGQNDPGNCAEFCVTDHHFYVNGTDNVITLSNAGTPQGCQDLVAEGTVPNQYGTWWYGRSNWCPGKEVRVETFDVTDQVTLGADNTFEHEGFRNGAPYTGSASMRMRSWLVISK